MTSGGLSYEVKPPPHARWSKVSVLCRHHPGEVIAEWSTFDGRQAMIKAPGLIQDYIGWMPDDDTRQHLNEHPAGRVLRVASAPPATDDQSHWRFTLPCPRPSCSYRPQIRDEQYRRLDALVLGLWTAGTAALVITDLEQTLRDWSRRK